MEEPNPNDALWRYILQEGPSALHRQRLVYHLLPSSPRCYGCKIPFGGTGGSLVRRFLHRYPSIHNPSLCNVCDTFVREHPGGTEIEMTVLFADVRGSTALAEGMSPTAFSHLMDRFYTVATEALVTHDAVIEKFIGDEVTALFVPGYAGPEYPRKAVQAAQAILTATGHEDPNGPWLPMGAGVHHGVAYIGSVGRSGVNQMTVLGDVANTGARLASKAATSEILISDAAYAAAGLDLSDLERRELELKGKSEPFAVRVLRVIPLPA